MRDDEWDAVEQYIYDNRDAFAGISLLPDGGDLDYPQAPFCSVPTTAELIENYGDGAMYASGIIEEAIEAFDGNLWAACDAVLGRATADFSQAPEIPPGTSAKVARAMMDEYAAKHNWMQRARKFAANYFNNDVLKMTRCLKRVNNCKLWDDINRTTIRVDYIFMEEHQDNTTVSQTVACGGGKCDVL